MGCSSSSSGNIEDPKELNPFFEPIKVGSIILKNRIVMAALTRCRSDSATGVPNDLMAEYYSQRAGFGFIHTECSQISPLSNAFPGSGGIYSNEQVEGWKKVTQKVHEKGGKIFLQIWHSGRAALSEFIGGEVPLAPSALAIRTPHSYTKGPHPVPKEMTKEDIKKVIEEFKKGAQNAKEAGFDGVQLHGANGYLVDQFLKDGTNKRTDEYGGSIENRARFLLESIDTLISVFGADNVGIKLSPTGRYNDELEKKKIAFVEIKRHGFVDGGQADEKEVDDFGQKVPKLQIPDFLNVWRPLYNGILILNDNIDYQTGLDLLKAKKADLISFGSLAISNPDLPQRFKNGWALAPSDYKTYFTPGKEGYTDYPEYKPQLVPKEELAQKIENVEKTDQAQQKVDKIDNVEQKTQHPKQKGDGAEQKAAHAEQNVGHAVKVDHAQNVEHAQHEKHDQIEKHDQHAEQAGNVEHHEKDHKKLDE